MQGTRMTVLLPKSTPLPFYPLSISLWMNRVKQRIGRAVLWSNTIWEVAGVCGTADSLYSRGCGSGQGQPWGIPWTGKGLICPINKQHRKYCRECGNECFVEMMSSPGTIPIAFKTFLLRSPFIPVTSAAQQSRKSPERNKENPSFLLFSFTSLK